MTAVGAAGPDSSARVASRTSAMVSGVYITLGRRPRARARRRKWASRSGSAIRSRGADTNATDVWPSSASRCMGRLTAAALSGPTRDTPLILSAVAFSATTGAPSRRSCQSLIDSPFPTGAMARPARRCADISRTCMDSRSSE